MPLTNEVHLNGKVATEPEKRGSGPIRFRLAHGGGGKRKDGTPWPTQFFSISVWDSALIEGLTKGQRIEVFGTLRESTWTAQDGSKRSAIEIVADAIQSEENPASGTAAARAVLSPARHEVFD